MFHLKVEDGFSIIVPTYREEKNITTLVERIAKLKLAVNQFEVLLVDDNSEDNTKNIVESLKAKYPWLKLIIRRDKRSWHKSILQGIQAATFPILIFMDADLSHPPEIIPQMLALLEQGHVDMVIGSRHITGGSIDKSWPLYRKIISRLATLVIQPLLPSTIKDPLSGFIAIKKTCYSVNGELWNPIGTKLALEIMVKSHVKNIIEIPICFEQRKQGESKLMTLKMALNYYKQIQQLWSYKLFGTKWILKK
jgi:dolichol-phosphate mannosyltransferase